MTGQTKQRLLNAGVVAASLGGYLEWGAGRSMFLAEGEAEVLAKLFTHPAAAAHPFTLVPLLGQVLLLVTVFQTRPSRLLTYLGIGSIGILLLFITLVGVVALNGRIFISTVPFIVLATLAVKEARRK